MIKPYSQSKFVEKILISGNGERFRVLFLVTLVNGEMKAQIVSAQPILVSDNRLLISGNIQSDSNNRFALPEGRSRNTILSPSYQQLSIVSPYIELYFFISQPTRAPSYK